MRSRSLTLLVLIFCLVFGSMAPELAQANQDHACLILRDSCREEAATLAGLCVQSCLGLPNELMNSCIDVCEANNDLANCTCEEQYEDCRTTRFADPYASVYSPYDFLAGFLDPGLPALEIRGYQ